MNSQKPKSLLIRPAVAASLVLLASGASFAAPQIINLTAGPTNGALPDGSNVPMWGYSCGIVNASSTASCSALNLQAGQATATAAAPTTIWSPVVITVPTGADLTINLTNSLSFTPTGATACGGTGQPSCITVPTSLVVAGQLGGGLGTPTKAPSPTHAPYGTTWLGTAGDTNHATFTPPSQADRVQSFGTEVAAGATTSLTWTAPRPGTYLLESGTHPSIQGPMGLYGILVVTAAPAVTTAGTTPGQAYPGVNYAAEVPLLLSEIDPIQNLAVQAAVTTPGFIETSARVLRDSVSSISLPLDQNHAVIPVGTGYTLADTINFLPMTACTTAPTATIGSVTAAGGISSINLTSGGAGCTQVPTITVTSTLGSGANIDPANPNITAALTLAGVMCSDGAGACYPPAVNYAPLYYLFNGVAFDKTQPTLSLFNTSPASATGAPASVLVRLVNAGLRMHVPSIVGALTTPATVAPGHTRPGASSQVPGFSLIAEDGNRLPGLTRVQSEVFMAAGKTYDVMIDAPAACTPVAPAITCSSPALPIFDRELSLSANMIGRDGGMLAYLGINGGDVTAQAAGGTTGVATARPDTYTVFANQTLVVKDPANGLIANDTNVYGVAVSVAPTAGTLSLNYDGTFSYAPTASTAVPPVPFGGDSFGYCANGTTPASPRAVCTTVTLAACGTACMKAPPTVADIQFTSNIASRYSSSPPGVLGGVTSNDGGYALTASLPTPAAGVTLATDGSFAAVGPGGPCPTLTPAAPSGSTCLQFQYRATNAQGTVSNTANATVIFLSPSNVTITVKDSITGGVIQDYRWIIEEDRTVWVDPKCQVNSGAGARPLDSYGRNCPPLPVESQGYNFHTANMPVVATGCLGKISCEQGQTVQGSPATCDIGNGVCRAIADPSGLAVANAPLGASPLVVDPSANLGKAPVDPGQVHLDPTKHYFISVLPGDGGNPTITAAGGPDANGKPFSIATACGPYALGAPAWVPGGPGAICGHAMGGAQIPPLAVGVSTYAGINISLQQTPLPTAQISVFIFQDDNPLNGENDSGGGVDVLAPNEPGLGGFNIVLFDQAGGLGDNTGQPTYDMFNQPLSNGLANKIDPITGFDACPINTKPKLDAKGNPVLDKNGKPVNDGLVGMIFSCPKYESDGKTLSPLAGQAVIKNLYPGLYEVTAYPAADRIARGEEWLQTNTLDGGKPHEAFIRPNEPGYFQEFGPGGFHVAIGFANPDIINKRKPGYCSNRDCSHTLTVNVSNNHMSRTPDQRTFSSGTYDHYNFTTCYVSVGPADAEDFAFQKCGIADPSKPGTVIFPNMPNGTYKIAVFDQWNDIMLDGLVGTLTVAGDTVIDYPVTQWRTNIFTRTFIDLNGDGVSNLDANGAPKEPGVALANTNIRYRDGSLGFLNNTDLNGFAGWNEVFPFMNWLVVETTATRFKPTGVHTVYDAGGPVDGTTGGGASTIGAHLANTLERIPLPASLRVPGARYCADADCTTAGSFDPTLAGPKSSGTVFPPQAWGNTMAWQGLLGQNSFVEFGVRPFNENENGGIRGHVVYASTRPHDDPALVLHQTWEPLVPRVKVNLYKKTVDTNGNDQLTLVDTTLTTSWDDWAQGFRKDASGNLLTDGSGNYIPNMNCPGQDSTNPFFATLKGSKNWLDDKDPVTRGSVHTIANNSQFKCYDGWSQLNQMQPAPYDGLYTFPSITATDPASGKPAKTNCTGCTTKDGDGNPMLPAGKYIVEVVVPTGFNLLKEEDKNILIGDIYIAPVSAQFVGFGNVFILPDQATVNAQSGPYRSNPYSPIANPNSPAAVNPTKDLGAFTFSRNEGDTGSIEEYWACAGAERIVPDVLSLFPGAQQTAPFAGAKRRLCDRKEVVLQDQSSVVAKFYIYSSTHIAGHFTGTITNDFASEFDPFSPQFGEKFGPPNLPVAMRDFSGNEVSRIHADQWGIYNGLYFSTWGVNPPNPTGYAPQMSIACMNDPGPIPDPANPGQMITDPSYNPAYSNFCYETPFMPGFTAYMDTPVIPTQAFADGYNLPDSEYPDGTPAIKLVTGDAPGPWVGGGGYVTTVTVTNGGSGYNNPPTVSFNNAATGGSGATATAVMSGYVDALALGAIRGSGYTSPTFPVNFTGGAPTTPATATATVGFPVGSVNLTNGGAYASAPAVTFSAPGNGGITATGTAVISGPVSALNLGAARGSGYTSPTFPVNFSGGGGSGAAATATVGFPVASVSVTTGGVYSSAPAVVFGAPGNGGVTATGTAVLSGSVVSVTRGNNQGSYSAPPAVSFGGTGSGAAATAVMELNTIAVTNAATNLYPVTTAAALTATVAFPSCGSTTTATCAPATVTAVASVAAPGGRRINGFTIGNRGIGYTGPAIITVLCSGVACPGTTTPVTYTETLRVNQLVLTSGGTNYASAPAVSLTAGLVNASAPTAAISGPVASVTIVNPGSRYTSAPGLTFAGIGGAAASSTLGGAGVVVSLALNNGGSGYSTTPAVDLTGGGGSGAVATAALAASRTVTSLVINNPGSRYTSPPTVTFGGSGGATGTAVLGTTGMVVSVALTNRGAGYTSLPAVDLNGGGGSGAVVTATLKSLVVAVTVTAGGSGYNGPPTVTFSGGGGSGAAATAMVQQVGTLTITALGDKVVQNPNFSGPNSNTAPYNTKTVTRHYGFGTGGTAVLVGSDGLSYPLLGVSWSDTTITGNVPAQLPPCRVQQPLQSAQCGELVITRSDNGKRSIDAITVTAGGSAPWVVTANDFYTNVGGVITAPAGKTVSNYGSNFGRMFFSPLQVAIDSASPGDLILVQPGVYKENVIMWKPVRLQGVGAASVTVNADAHPAGKMDSWRRQTTCVFGLSLDGTPNPGNTNYAGTDPNNNGYSCPAVMYQRVDRIPFEAIVGWDASGNGNLAQVLQEPTLMGAYEGAGVTVLGRGARIPANSTDFWGQQATGGAGSFTDGTVWLTNSPADCTQTPGVDSRDYGTSNFYCNPSRIDGISVANSSQGGGGIFVHGWAHNLEVANLRVFGNNGTLAGAINLGNGEAPNAFINDGVECGAGLVVMPCPPIPQGTALNAAIPFAFNTHVRIHHNMLYNNASIGDALFSGTPAGAGGITVSAGADDYQIDHNWVAGNLSTGDGGGLQHLGLSFHGKIDHNYILFNQSTNPTLPTNGGGVVIEGANLDRLLGGIECGSVTDQDCPPGLGEGTGPGLVVDANLILGNSAESGSGGGLRIQQVNGTELTTFPLNIAQWYDITVTNNIIANNVAGYDGAGVSIQDALQVRFINNTVVSNDTTASAGVLFKTLGAIYSSTPPPGCTPTTDPTVPQNPNCTIDNAQHGKQPSGLVTMAHTPNLVAQMPADLLCPAGFHYGNGNGADTLANLIDGLCRTLSLPSMVNDLFWQNRAFSVDIVDQNGHVVTGPTTPTGTGLASQQNLIALTPLLNQVATGACAAGAYFWDVGVRTDDVTAGLVRNGALLSPNHSILTSNNGVAYSPSNVVPGNSPVLAQFCNGARVPPENCLGVASQISQASCNGYNAPAGSSETTGTTQLFSFTNIKPTATVDEGHNWLNLSYGPLTMTTPTAALAKTTTPAELMVANGAVGSVGGAYSILGTSPAVNRGTGIGPLPGTVKAGDFFGNPRAKASVVDIGAVAYQRPANFALIAANPNPLAFTDLVAGTTDCVESALQGLCNTRDLVVTNNGTTAFTLPTPAFATPDFLQVTTGSFAGLPASCAPGAVLPAGSSCTVRVQWTVAGAGATVSSSVTLTGVADSPVAIKANAVAATYLAIVGPSPLAFGNWVTGSTSAGLDVVVTNTGNSNLTGLTYTGLGAGTRFTRSAAGTFPVTAPNCGATLEVATSCTVRVLFAPTALQAYSSTLTVGAPAGVTITNPVVALTGTGVGTASAVLVSSPVQVTLTSPTAFPLEPSTYSNLGVVTLTNMGPAGSAQVAITGVQVTTDAGGVVPGTFSQGPLTGPDTCTGKALAPGATCTVGIRYTVSPAAARSPGATATAVINASGQVTGFINLRGGSGYNPLPFPPPEVAIRDGGGAGATAHAVVDGTGKVSQIVLDTPGVNYTTVPVVVIDGGVGTTGKISFTDTGAASPQTGILQGIATP